MHLHVNISNVLLHVQISLIQLLENGQTALCITDIFTDVFSF